VIASADLVLGSGQFTIPGGFIIDMAEGGHLRTSSNGFSVSQSSSTSPISGNLTLFLPFHALSNSKSYTFQILDGAFTLPLSVSESGKLTGRECAIFGTLPIDFSDSGKPSLVVSVPIRIAHGTLTAGEGDTTAATFNGDLTLTLPKSLAIPVSTDRTDDNENKHTFSISARVGVPAAVDLNGSITFDGLTVKVPEIRQRSAFTLEILSGNGEHNDNDGFQSTNGNNAPYQEVFTDQFCFPHCRLHVYLVPHTYPATSVIDFQLTDSEVSLTLSDTILGEQPTVDSCPQSSGVCTDGCDSIFNPCVDAASALRAIKGAWKTITGLPGDPSLADLMRDTFLSKISAYKKTLKRNIHPVGN
jgi:hypothetical protein